MEISTFSCIALREKRLDKMIKVKKKEKKIRKITTEEERCSNGNFGNLHPDCNLFFLTIQLSPSTYITEEEEVNRKEKKKKLAHTTFTKNQYTCY